MQRLEDAREERAPRKKWGPYLSERQWGTVREDYSRDGNAWDYFSHDQARSRAYHWGEDGLAGVSDDHQVLCFSIARSARWLHRPHRKDILRRRARNQPPTTAICSTS